MYPWGNAFHLTVVAAAVLKLLLLF